MLQGFAASWGFVALGVWGVRVVWVLRIKNQVCDFRVGLVFKVWEGFMWGSVYWELGFRVCSRL